MTDSSKPYVRPSMKMLKAQLACSLINTMLAERSFFSICVLNELKVERGEIYNLLNPLHCQHWRHMSPEFKQHLPLLLADAVHDQYGLLRPSDKVTAYGVHLLEVVNEEEEKKQKQKQKTSESTEMVTYHGVLVPDSAPTTKGFQGWLLRLLTNKSN